MLDWNDLRHFLALADEGSLSAAARRLEVEHATVARRIASLEAHLGLRLVDRRGGRYALTREGERAASSARHMQDEAIRLVRGGLSAEGSAPATVTATMPPTIASELVIPRLGTFQRTTPWVDLRLLGSSRNLSLVNEADIALRLSRPDTPTLVVRRVGAIAYDLYGSDAYLRGRSKEAWEFIALEADLRDLAQQKWLDRIAGDRRTVFRSNDLNLQCAAVAAGLGLAALPRFLGKAHGFRRVRTERPIQREIWLTYHRDLKSSPAIRAVAEFLVGCLPRCAAN